MRPLQGAQAVPPPPLQVWLPLLPRLGAPGFELVWAENWSLRMYKGAVWDASAQRVRFAGDEPPVIAVS